MFSASISKAAGRDMTYPHYHPYQLDTDAMDVDQEGIADVDMMDATPTHPTFYGNASIPASAMTPAMVPAAAAAVAATSTPQPQHTEPVISCCMCQTVVPRRVSYTMYDLRMCSTQCVAHWRKLCQSKREHAAGSSNGVFSLGGGATAF